MGAAAPYIPLVLSALSTGAAVYSATRKPETPDIKTAPLPDDEAIRRTFERQLGREDKGGRASTVLTGPGSASKLG